MTSHSTKSYQSANKRFKKKLLPHRVLFESAIAIALLVHVVLFASLRISPPPEPSDVEKKEPPCVLVAASDQKSFAWEKKLWWWVRIKNPAFLSQPNEEYGFSSIRTSSLSWPYTTPPSYTFTATPHSEFVYPDIKIVGDYLSFPKKVSMAFPSVSIQVPSIAAEITLPDSIVWRNPDGTVIESPPAISISKNEILKRRARVSPSSPTKLEVIRDKGLARARIRESCGNPQLDLVALDALKEKLERLPENTPDTVRAEERAPYIPPLNANRRLEVEWRLLKEKSPDKKSE